MRTDDATTLRTLVHAFTPFRAPRGAPPDARLDLRIDYADVWSDESPEPRAEVAGGLVRVEHRDFVGVIAADGGQMVAVHSRRVLAVENALRVLYALLLVRNDGLLLHAAGIVREPGATVLFGSSGSGKTTAARMARGRVLLGDDLIALRESGDRWYAHATPFGGLAARRRRSRSAPLRELFRLRQGPRLDVGPIAPARAVAELLQSAVLPAALPDDRRLALERCESLWSEVGVHELTFPLDNGLWRWLDERAG